MDSPPEKGEDVQPFIDITNILRDLKLSAPEIFSSDAQNGWLLLEDLGPQVFATTIENDPKLEQTLYEHAVDLLLELHQSNIDWPDAYDSGVYARELSLVTDWYLPATGTETGSLTTLASAFQHAFDAQCQGSKALVLRDYHAENLIWLPDRKGINRVGLLDYQDALIGHPAYDLVSLLEDARRDVSPELQATMLERYLSSSKIPKDEFVAAYNLLGAQRNLKIIGIFTRLSKRDNKPKYIDLIPRVWAHLQRDLKHPACVEIRDWVRKNMPKPNAKILSSLR